jgi:serine phosphatase RsbU (regulator of sigma subunit)
MVPGLEYTETVVGLASGDVVLMLTDGVVEAQSASGELFGFDRTRSISVQPAAQIAAAAQAYGQNDDITVLSMTLTADEAFRT